MTTTNANIDFAATAAVRLSGHQKMALEYIAAHTSPLKGIVDARVSEVGDRTAVALAKLGLVERMAKFRHGRNYRSGQAWAHTDVTVALTLKGWAWVMMSEPEVVEWAFENAVARCDGLAESWADRDADEAARWTKRSAQIAADLKAITLPI